MAASRSPPRIAGARLTARLVDRKVAVRDLRTAGDRRCDDPVRGRRRGCCRLDRDRVEARDGLDLGRFPLFDCNGNGIEDAVDLALGAPDCNGNGVIDTCEYAISTYCPTGVTTNGCTPTMTWAGTPTASLACPFSMTVTSVEGAKSGIIFYGVSGAVGLPWGGGSMLCVKAPTQRTPAQVSGGTTGLCDGTLFLDFNAYMAANPLSIGQPLFPGEAFFFQGWFRDPPSPKTTHMSNALRFTLAP